ncbi:hypothetical protein M427DRAFT_367010 [Gonapodya prolifera JEL478]|uniref:Uncharacterized protein n=1 Tax=Gonapodya prolifera (strain JEL478) TaxID=1344416 RepID=A0A139AAC1_GONPJ|nr:hypothetical protein M427DRAFT_367010 [Gonapodya prolifera JEL478]|eukprot:KXS13445.1 hypothetical protein M427DRAFT_367010 [Gonapodya prolifera JEL478]
MLNHQMQHIWRLFDTQLLEPVWSVSDPLLPMYQRLSRILHDLDLMRQRGGYTSAQVTSVQRELNDIENEHMDEWYRLQPSLASDNALPSAEREEETSSDAPATTHSQNSYSILGGQAVLRSLLERCYRLVRLCIEESTPVARSLVPIRNRLLALHLTLRGIKEGAKQLGGGGGDPVEVKAVQERLREIESFSRDGKFVDERGNIPDGQAELRILLEESYALAHSLLVKSEKHETFAT